MMAPSQWAWAALDLPERPAARRAANRAVGRRGAQARAAVAPPRLGVQRNQQNREARVAARPHERPPGKAQRKADLPHAALPPAKRRPVAKGRRRARAERSAEDRRALSK